MENPYNKTPLLLLRRQANAVYFPKRSQVIKNKQRRKRQAKRHKH